MSVLCYLFLLFLPDLYEACPVYDQRSNSFGGNTCAYEKEPDSDTYFTPYFASEWVALQQQQNDIWNDVYNTTITLTELTEVTQEINNSMTILQFNDCKNKTQNASNYCTEIFDDQESINNGPEQKIVKQNIDINGMMKKISLKIHDYNSFHTDAYKAENILHLHRNYYITEFGTTSNIWIVFSPQNDDLLFYPIKFRMKVAPKDWSFIMERAPKRFQLSIGSSDNQWIKLHKDMMIGKNTSEWQEFDLSINVGAFNNIRDKTYNHLNLTIFDNYGHPCHIHIMAIEVFGVVIDNNGYTDNMLIGKKTADWQGFDLNINVSEKRDKERYNPINNYERVQQLFVDLSQL
eukprot:412728_1